MKVPRTIQPTIAAAILSNRLETPPLLISTPANMKNGIANSGKESNEVNAFWAIMPKGKLEPK